MAATITASPTGRPRDDRIDRAVLDAAIELCLDRPYGRVTLAEIARRARTSRNAIARRWPTKAHVVRDAFMLHNSRLDVRDTGSLRGDLMALTHQNLELFSSPNHKGLTLAALAALGDLGLDYPGIPQPRRHSIAAIFERARQRGDLPLGVDPIAVTQLLGGAILFRSVILDQPTSPTDVATLVDTCLGSRAQA